MFDVSVGFRYSRSSGCLLARRSGYSDASEMSNLAGLVSAASVFSHLVQKMLLLPSGDYFLQRLAALSSLANKSGEMMGLLMSL